MSNSTQNDWADAFREKFEGKNVPLNSVHPMMIDSQIIFIQKLLADARKEVEEKVMRLKKYRSYENVVKTRIVDGKMWLDYPEVDLVKLNDVLATLREEGVK